MPCCCCLRAGHEMYALRKTKSVVKSWVWLLESRPMKVVACFGCSGGGGGGGGRTYIVGLSERPRRASLQIQQ